MKILVFTTLYPNSQMPNHGVFVRRRIDELAKEHEMVVVAPVPWHKFSKISMEEKGVYHPRYFMTPKILRSLYGIFMFLSVVGFVKKLDKEHKFDLIDGHFVYPDGMAAVLLGQALKKKVILTARGTDINWYPKFWLIRKLIQWTLREANSIISVSDSLKEEMVKLGVEKEKIKVIPNGIDIDKFYPILKDEARKILGLPRDKKVIVSIGLLTERKGFKFLIEALSYIKREDILLFIIGEGEWRGKLESLIKKLNLENQIKLLGEKPQEELHKWYSASDIFCLTSLREGRPNVVIEALACGCPVVSMNKWDLSSIVTQDMGILLGFYEPKVIAKAIEKALDRNWDRKKISDRMKDFSWEKTASDVSEIFKKTAEKKDILFFSSDDWDSGLKTSKYHLAINLCKNNRVIFIESIGLRKPHAGSGRDINKIFNKLRKWSKGLRKINENLYIYTPIVIPFHDNGFIRVINSILLKSQINSISKKMTLKNPIYWTFMPNTVGLFKKRDVKVIYYCVDNMSAFNGVDRHEISKMDEELTKRADIVFTVSRKIYEEKKELNSNTYYMPHGVNYEHFAGNGKKIKELDRIKRPIIGFHGLISKDWVDFGLVVYIAEKHPEWSIVMIGKIDTDKESLPGNKNIHYLGTVDYSVLPSYAHCFDVAMIPFNINELTKYCNPLKIYEYFAMGKPVVSVEIPEVRHLNGMTRIGQNYEEFVKGIEDALKEDNKELRLKRMEFAKARSWESKTREVMEIINRKNICD